VGHVKDDDASPVDLGVPVDGCGSMVALVDEVLRVARGSVEIGQVLAAAVTARPECGMIGAALWWVRGPSTVLAARAGRWVDGVERYSVLPLTAGLPVTEVARTGTALNLEVSHDLARNFPTLVAEVAAVGIERIVVVPVGDDRGPVAVVAVTWGSTQCSALDAEVAATVIGGACLLVARYAAPLDAATVLGVHPPAHVAGADHEDLKARMAALESTLAFTARLLAERLEG
jgi:hypothetical protein